MRVIPENESMTIPGIPPARLEQLQQLWAGPPRLEAVWLFGSRAKGRHEPCSDIDLCLEGSKLDHNDRLALTAAVDDLLLPWRMDLVLRQKLPTELDAHVQRVGQRIWAAPAIPRRTLPMDLFVYSQTYHTPERQLEIDECLRLNLNHPDISPMVLFYEKDGPPPLPQGTVTVEVEVVESNERIPYAEWWRRASKQEKQYNNST